MKLKKLTAALLAALTACSLLTACSEDPSPDPKPVHSDTPAEEVQTAPETEPEETEVPFRGIASADMGGKTFTIVSEDWWGWAPLEAVDIVVEDLTGEVFNDAVYNRNVTVRQDLNCEVASVIPANTAMNFTPVLTKSIQAGDSQYDIALVRNGSASYGSCVLKGYLLDLKEVPNVDFSNPWWKSNYYEQMSINGKGYGVLSDISTLDERCLFITYFNKKLITDYNLSVPYDLVAEGTWTYDTMFSMSEKVSSDLDGNGFLDYQDLFGVAYVQDVTTGILCSCGVLFAEKNADSLVSFTFPSDRSYEVYMNIIPRMYDETICFNTQIRKDGYDGSDDGLFTSGHVLFQLGGVYHAELMREMEDDFGMVPYPKYTEEQKDYLTGVLPTALPLTTIPVSNTDLGNTGIFMEYYSYLGYRDIMPVFYETLLKGKVARDDISTKMLDMVFSDPVADIGVAYDFGSFSSNLMLRTNQRLLEVASYTESQRKVVEKEISKFNEQMLGN